MSYFKENFEGRCSATYAPTQLSFFTAAISFILLIFNIPGNLLVILSVAIDPHKNLRKPFNYLMANLAVADLIVGVVTDPLFVILHIEEGLHKLSSDVVRVAHMSYFILCTASVLSLASLAVERYLAICNPHTYRNTFTGKRILITLGCIWFISLTLPFVYFEVDFINYTFIFANTSIAVAMAITCFTYAMMSKKSKERSRNLDVANSTTNVANQDIEVAPTPARNQLHDNAVHQEQKVTEMFLVVMVAFLCSYGPATIFIYALNFCESCSCAAFHCFRELLFLFVIMNSNMNFFCYGLRSPRFRRAFAHILRIKRRDRATEGSNTVMASFY